VVNPQNKVQIRLDAARKDLLDLGLRNSLLNYRLLRARGVEVIDELPAEVFRLLAREGKAMSFLPAPDPVSGANQGSQHTAHEEHVEAASTLLLAQPESLLKKF
jgi:Protein of unknown function (DUF4011)